MYKIEFMVNKSLKDAFKNLAKKHNINQSDVFLQGFSLLEMTSKGLDDGEKLVFENEDGETTNITGLFERRNNKDNSVVEDVPETNVHIKRLEAI